MTLGVTVGKFYPFHRGHDLLLRRAKAEVDRLAVLVAWKPGQALPGPLRAAWIREEHPDVDVVEVLDDIDEAPGPWARRTLEVLGRRPDVAFTSEDYGAPWAGLMGARHVSIDPARAEVPCSGTALRADLAASWEHLTPPAKAHFARRVVVLGVESSGTTTLARALAAHFQTVWVPEYGRVYAEGRLTAGDAPWRTGELLHIARAQAASEDALARQANRLLVCDTDPLATTVWHRRYVGDWSPEVERVARERRHDLHVLTLPDFPFVQDGTRDGEHVRHDMHRWFVEALERRGAPFVVVGGSHERRLAEAVAAIEPLLRFDPVPDP